MKIHFDGVNFSSSSGPNTFANRLAKQFYESGHEISLSNENCDISLVFIERSGNPLAKKVVQRLDGIWFKPEEFHVKNSGIKRLYESADAVIFQSRFDKQMIEKSFQRLAKKYAVIHNGINLNPVKQISIPKLIEMRAAYDKIFVCSANWHPQKRLRSNVEAFNHIRKTQFSNSCLIVLGNNPDYIESGPHVFYAGSVAEEVYMQIYAVADWFLHLAWLDHCPNVVIEALSQGTPVICSDSGGTKELIGNYGIVLKERDTYCYELADYDNPPQIDITQLGHIPERKDLHYDSITNIDITSTAKNYLTLFTSLLKK